MRKSETLNTLNRDVGNDDFHNVVETRDIISRVKPDLLSRLRSVADNPVFCTFFKLHFSKKINIFHFFAVLFTHSTNVKKYTFKISTKYM